MPGTLALLSRRARLVAASTLLLSPGAAAAVALQVSAAPRERGEEVAGFDRLVAGAVRRFGLPGAAVAVVDDGEVVLAKGYGLADCESGAPVTADTRFNIGSVSKLLTAWGVMRLLDQERIALDTPVQEYVHGWKLPASRFDASGVTVRRLLSHTAGLSLHGYPGFALDEPLPTLVESLSGATNGAGKVELVAEPGSVHSYSGGGYTLLQLLCEERTGQPFATYMHEALLAPLGMERTGFNRDPALEEGTARPHAFLHDPIPDRAFRAEAAAAAYTTLDDALRLALAFFDLGPEAPAGRGVLRPETVALLGSLAPESGGLWAHGPMVLSEPGPHGELVIGHAGDNAGWHALIAVRPASRDALVVLTNGEAGPTLRELLQGPWSALVGIDPPLAAFRPPAALAVVGTLLEQGGIAAVEEYLRLKEHEAEAYELGPRPLGWITDSLLAAERAEDALAFATLGVDQYPHLPATWVALARAYRALGDVDEARDACERALELAPGDPAASALEAELR